MSGEEHGQAHDNDVRTGAQLTQKSGGDESEKHWSGGLAGRLWQLT
jgi:hypothetical protein